MYPVSSLAQARTHKKKPRPFIFHRKKQSEERTLEIDDKNVIPQSLVSLQKKVNSRSNN